jgi:hypothetical protein
MDQTFRERTQNFRSLYAVENMQSSLLYSHQGKGYDLAKDETPLNDRQKVLRRLQEETRIRGGNDAIVRACMVGFGIVIASIAPVTWGWKLALFLIIMLLVGIIIPAIWRARQNPK